jgi:hypothetical protein
MKHYAGIDVLFSHLFVRARGLVKWQAGRGGACAATGTLLIAGVIARPKSGLVTDSRRHHPRGSSLVGGRLATTAV